MGGSVVHWRKQEFKSQTEPNVNPSHLLAMQPWGMLFNLFEINFSYPQNKDPNIYLIGLL